MKRTILFSLVLLLSMSLRADYHVTEHLLVNDGLSNNFVKDIVQDNRGIFWIATESGLNSFDGVSFLNYNMSNTTLGSNMINCLWFDADRGSLWVGTKGKGICRLDTGTGQVTNFNLDDDMLDNVMSITPADDGRLWAICHEKIVLVNPEDGEIEPLMLEAAHQYFRCGVDDGNGNLVVGSYMNGACVLNGSTRELIPLSMGEDESSRDNVNEIIKDHSGRIWVATSTGLWFYQPGSTRLIQCEAVRIPNVSHLAEVDGNSIWFSSDSFVQILNLKTEEVTSFQPEGDIPLVSVIQKIYQDRHGNLWIGGQGDGISFMSHQPPLFQKLYSGSIWGIYVDKDITWVGTRDHLLGFRGTRQVQDIPVSVGGRTFGAIFAINGDRANTLYAAVPYNMLALDKRTGKARIITKQDGSRIEALTFYREQDGTFWISATDGVYTLQNDVAIAADDINQALNRQSAHGIRRDKQGKLWVATYENGIYLFDHDNQLITHLSQQSQQSGVFPNSIQHLKVDSHDRLWLSTPDGPCCIPDTRYPERYILYGYKEGMLDTYVRAIQEDREGNIWVSTNNGISMLNMTENTFVNYNSSDYIPVNNFTGGAILQEDGGLVFTSLDGLCHCYPDEIGKRREQTPVALLSVFGLATGKADRTDRKLVPDAEGTYHLNFDESSFQMVFGSSDYSCKNLLEYQYRIDSREGQWIPFENGVVAFRSLTSGRYNITVRTRLKGQKWDDQHIIQTTFLIHHPWWGTPWAKLLYALVFMSIVWCLFIHYKRRLQLENTLELVRRKNIDEQERNAERLQFFTNITHELRTPLTLIQAPLEELLRQKDLNAEHAKMIQIVYDSAKRLNALCNKLLDFRKAETHNQQLKVCRGRMSAALQSIGESFAELNTNPELKIEVQTVADDQPIFFDEETLRSILTNLLSNAIKYTPRGSVILSQEVYQQDAHSYTAVKVKDTGYGISAENIKNIFDRYYQVRGAHQASGTGIGLSIVKSLAELHEIDLHVDSEEGRGTTFTLRFDNENTYPNALRKESQPDVETVEPNRDETPDNEADQRPLVLLVEDDREILSFMADSLANDYRILKAHNGQLGCNMARERIPDLIVSDIMMPVMDGITLCKTLKNDLRTSHIPIIMLTAKDTLDDKQTGYESGADSYLTKPFSMQMLRVRIQNLLRARAALSSWINAQSMRHLGDVQATPAPSAEQEAAATDSTPQLSVFDKNFLRDVHAYIIEHISQESIRMEDIAQSLNMSHSTLYRKIKALTGLSGAEYIRRTRVIHSAELMREGHCNISEAAYKCGFSSLPYFRSAFKDVFGMPPSEYLKQ